MYRVNRYWQRFSLQLTLGSCLAIGGAIASCFDCAKAQIARSPSLGAENSIFIPGARFREFNVGVERKPDFFNPNSHIQNIALASNETGLITTKHSALLFNRIPVQAISQELIISVKFKQLPTTVNVLILQSLVCNSTAAGGSYPDQITLKVENENVWSYSMNAGDQVNLPPLYKIFKKKVYIELFAGSTSLGGKYIMNSGKGSLSFTKGQASYTLTYEVD